MKSLATTVLLALLCAIAFAQSGNRGTIILKVDGFKSDDGQCRIYLFNSDDGFPSKPAKACAAAKVKIVNQQIEEAFADLPYGTYAFSVHHDVNGNDKIDSNWMHIPKEPYGASNGARSSFGPPSFKRAKFELNSGSMTVLVKVK